jgi:hypothetical protein
MLIATFGESTGWAGKTITRDGNSFFLQDHGPISAADVMEYDRQGQLVWATEGTRGWVGAQAQSIGQISLIATFNASTGWDGKTITHDDGRFLLADHGGISAQNIMKYDAEGQLTWASADMRAWVLSRAHEERETTAARAAFVRAGQQSGAQAKSTSPLNVAGGILLGLGIIVLFYFVAVFDISVPVDTGGYFDIDRVNNIGLMNDQRNGIIVGVLMSVGGIALLVVGAVQKGRTPTPVSARSDERKCPYCAETIKADAVICRFCNRDVSRGTAG